MPDPFDSFGDSATAPSRAPFAIQPSDTDPLPFITKAIYVGSGGHVTLRGVAASSDVTYKNVASSTYLEVRASHVRATGTTAADLIGEA